MHKNFSTKALKANLKSIDVLLPDASSRIYSDNHWMEVVYEKSRNIPKLSHNHYYDNISALRRSNFPLTPHGAFALLLLLDNHGIEHAKDVYGFSLKTLPDAPYLCALLHAHRGSCGIREIDDQLNVQQLENGFNFGLVEMDLDMGGLAGNRRINYNEQTVIICNQLNQIGEGLKIRVALPANAEAYGNAKALAKKSKTNFANAVIWCGMTEDDYETLREVGRHYNYIKKKATNSMINEVKKTPEQLGLVTQKEGENARTELTQS